MTLKASHPGLRLVVTERGVAIEVTRRADLAADRMLTGRDVLTLGVIATPTLDEADKLHRVLERVFCRAGSLGTLAENHVADVLARCRAMGRYVVHAQGERPKQRKVSPAHLYEYRAVPDPLVTRAQLLELLDQQEAEEARAMDNHRRTVRAGRRRNGKLVAPPPRAPRPNLQAGYQVVAVFVRDQIGGLAGIRDRTPVQSQAAAEFRRVAEAAELGGARAIDYAAVKVDTSGVSASAVADRGAEARAVFHAARVALAKEPKRLAVIERMVLGGQNISEAAVSAAVGRGGNGRRKTAALALQGCDVLADTFGLNTKGRRQLRAEAEPPTTFSEDGEGARVLKPSRGHW